MEKGAASDRVVSVCVCVCVCVCMQSYGLWADRSASISSQQVTTRARRGLDLA